MEILEILEEFERRTGPLPREAVEAAVERREEITPVLLRILEDTLERAKTDSGNGRSAHLFAMLLLAQFREIRAYPLVLRLTLLPSELLEELCGDFITENMGQILASVCGGELEGIQSLIENEAADEWARCAGLTSLLTLVGGGVKSRDEIVAYLASLFRDKLRRENVVVWSSLVSVNCSLQPAELFDDIEAAYAEGLADPMFLTPDDVEYYMAVTQEEALSRLRERYRLVEDTCDEISWWACFHEPPPPKARPSIAVSAVVQAFRKQPKTGRNDPCPCGSGKKYKKCCGA